MSRVPHAALELQSIEEIRTTVKRGIELALKRTASAEFAKRFHAACPIDGAEDEDYLFRILDFPGGDAAIWGIHFEGSVVRKPFVRLVYSTLPPIARLEEISERAKVDFAKFLPLAFSFYDEAGLPYAVDTTVFSAPLLKLQASDEPLNYSRVRVLTESSIAFYPEYEMMYHELRKTNDEALSVQESRESLQEAVSQQLMFRILIDEETAGFFGLRSDYDRYLSGYYVIEEILSRTFRGRGFGAAVQRRVIDELVSPPDLIIGMIDSRNAPSWRTAQSVGRQPIYSAYWYPLA